MSHHFPPARADERSESTGVAGFSLAVVRDVLLPQPGELMTLGHVRFVVLAGFASEGFLARPAPDPWGADLRSVVFVDSDDGAEVVIHGDWAEVLAWFNRYLDPNNTEPPVQMGIDCRQRFLADRIGCCSFWWSLWLAETILPGQVPNGRCVVTLADGTPHQAHWSP